MHFRCYTWHGESLWPTAAAASGVKTNCHRCRPSHICRRSHAKARGSLSAVLTRTASPGAAVRMRLTASGVTGAKEDCTSCRLGHAKVKGSLSAVLTRTSSPGATSRIMAAYGSIAPRSLQAVQSACVWCAQLIKLQRVCCARCCALHACRSAKQSALDSRGTR